MLRKVFLSIGAIALAVSMAVYPPSVATSAPLPGDSCLLIVAPEWAGSGVPVGTHKVVTAAHVAAEVDPPFLMGHGFNGFTTILFITRISEECDLALLSSVEDLVPVELSPVPAERGQPVIVVGSAARVLNAYRRGYVAQVDAEGHLILDVMVRPGDSGGAVLSLDGKLLGITVAVYTGALGAGYGVAEPVSEVARLMSLEENAR